jgi:hypothetical protein
MLKDLPSREMDTRFWGPSGWRLIHLIAAAKRNESTPFFELLPYVLPCKFCRASLADYYAADPLPAKESEYPEWIYRIHNQVNKKLRDQKLPTAPNPSWEAVRKKYEDWVQAPCTAHKMVGWDFLYSIAYTTPCRQVPSVPLPGAPTDLPTLELRNRWNQLTQEERLEKLREFWAAVPLALPFEEWRTAWTRAATRPPLKKGRKAVTKWLFQIEQSICKELSEPIDHTSSTTLCKELSQFESGCGKKRSQHLKTCRSIKKKARETIKRQRGGIR